MQNLLLCAFGVFGNTVHGMEAGEELAPGERAERSPVAVAVRLPGGLDGSPGVRLATGAVQGFEVDLRCTGELPSGSTVHVELEALAARPGAPAEALGIGCTASPFNAEHTRREQEIVVALGGSTHGLRVLELVNGVLLPRYQVVSSGIEAIDIGDVDGDGLDEIAVGLAGGSKKLLIYRHDPVADELILEYSSPSHAMHIEALAIGDADNDGKVDVVVGLERVDQSEPTNVSRLLIYRNDNGTWTGPFPIAVPDTRSCQAIAIADVDNDGKNDVVAQFANTYPETMQRQLRRYWYVGGQWGRENITPLTPTTPRSDRMVVADVDGDGKQEIVTTYWHMSGSGMVLTLESDGSGGWNETIIDSGLGMIDALTVGDYDHDGLVQIVVGTHGNSSQSQLRSYQYAFGSWGPGTTLTDMVANSLFRDAEVGDADNDGCHELVGARDDQVLVYESGSTQPVASVTLFPLVDSAQLGDIDNDALGSSVKLQLGPLEGCTVPFPLRAEAPAGTSWDVHFRAQVVVRAPGAPPERSTVESRPIRIEVVPRR